MPSPISMYDGFGDADWRENRQNFRGLFSRNVWNWTAAPTRSDMSLLEMWTLKEAAAANLKEQFTHNKENFHRYNKDN